MLMFPHLSESNKCCSFVGRLVCLLVGLQQKVTRKARGFSSSILSGIILAGWRRGQEKEPALGLVMIEGGGEEGKVARFCRRKWCGFLRLLWVQLELVPNCGLSGNLGEAASPVTCRWLVPWPYLASCRACTGSK